MDKGKGLVFFWRSCHKRVSFIFNSTIFPQKLCLLCFCQFILYVYKKALVKQEKCFYFTLEASFVLEIIKSIQFLRCHQMPKHETRKRFTGSLGKYTQSGNEIWPIYGILQKQIFITKLYEKCGLETSFQLFLIFKESSVKRDLRRSVSLFG